MGGQAEATGVWMRRAHSTRSRRRRAARRTTSACRGRARRPARSPPSTARSSARAQSCTGSRTGCRSPPTKGQTLPELSGQNGGGGVAEGRGGEGHQHAAVPFPVAGEQRLVADHSDLAGAADAQHLVRVARDAVHVARAGARTLGRQATRITTSRTSCEPGCWGDGVSGLDCARTRSHLKRSPRIAQGTTESVRWPTSVTSSVRGSILTTLLAVPGTP